MLRVALAAMFLFAPERTSSRGPTDVESMNRFAHEYNLYAERLHGGIVDLKQWERVRRAWQSMSGE